jgi:hypothetical protein
MQLIKLDEVFYLIDKENKPIKGQKFLILCEDESFGEVEELTCEFDEYADEDWMEECHTLLASSKKIAGVKYLDSNTLSKLDLVDKYQGKIETPYDFVLFIKSTYEHKDLHRKGEVSKPAPGQYYAYDTACELVNKNTRRTEWEAIVDNYNNILSVI